MTNKVTFFLVGGGQIGSGAARGGQWGQQPPHAMPLPTELNNFSKHGAITQI